MVMARGAGAGGQSRCCICAVEWGRADWNLDGDAPVGRGAEEAPLGEAAAAVCAGPEKGVRQAHAPPEPAVEDQPRWYQRGPHQLRHRRNKHVDRRREPATPPSMRAREKITPTPSVTADCQKSSVACCRIYRRTRNRPRGSGAGSCCRSEAQQCGRAVSDRPKPFCPEEHHDICL